MANQMALVTNSRRKRNQIAELNARQSLLPMMIQNKQRQEDLSRQEELKDIQIGQFEEQQDLAKDNLTLDRDRFAAEQSMFKKSQKAENKASRIGMGLEAAKLGVSVAERYGGSAATAGNLIPSLGAAGAGGAGAAGLLSQFNVGSFASGGLAGFGASRMVSKKKKAARLGVGAGAGALTGFLSGGLGGAISGGIGGGIGSLF